MDGTYPVDMWMVFHFWFYRLEGVGEFLLGLYQVYLCQETITVENLLGERAYLVSEVGEDADNLLALLALQLTHTVVGLYHLGRFDEDRLTCSTLIVDDTLDFLLKGRDDRNHQSSVT